MNMKRLLLFAFILIAVSHVLANDSLKIINLQREVSDLKSSISRLQQEDGRLKGLYLQQAKELDSLRMKQQLQTENVKTLAEKVGADISDANQKIDSNVSTHSQKASTVVLGLGH